MQNFDHLRSVTVKHFLTIFTRVFRVGLLRILDLGFTVFTLQVDDYRQVSPPIELLNVGAAHFSRSDKGLSLNYVPCIRPISDSPSLTTDNHSLLSIPGQQSFSHDNPSQLLPVYVSYQVLYAAIASIL